MMKKNKVTQNARAYTIIEILVSVLILGVLSILAVGFYDKYMAKTMVEQAIHVAVPLQQSILDFYQRQGYMPGYSDMSLSSLPSGYYLDSFPRPCVNNPAQDIATICYWNDTATCTPSNSNCDGTGKTARRQIEITFSNPTSRASGYLSGMIFMLRANVSSAGLSWVCRTYDSPPNQLNSILLPNGCAG